MASHLVRVLYLLFYSPGDLIHVQANIFGTEQDRVNCSFYYKVGPLQLLLPGTYFSLDWCLQTRG